MKKINLLIIFILAGTISFMTSCKNDDDDFAPPTITFTTGTQTVDEGVAVTIAFKVTTEAELSKVRLYIGDDQYGDPITEFSNKQEYLFSEVVDTAETTFTFKVIAEDNQDKLSDEEVTITVTPTATGTLTEYTVTLGADYETEPSFIDFLTGTLYDATDAPSHQTEISALHLHGGNGPSLYSPFYAWDHYSVDDLGDLGNWTTRQTTKFVVVSTADYDNITYDDVTTGASNATDQEALDLSAGNLVFFKTDSGRCGLIKVGTITKGILTIDLTYKVQNEVPTK